MTIPWDLTLMLWAFIWILALTFGPFLVVALWKRLMKLVRHLLRGSEVEVKP